MIKAYGEEKLSQFGEEAPEKEFANIISRLQHCEANNCLALGTILDPRTWGSSTLTALSKL